MTHPLELREFPDHPLQLDKGFRRMELLPPYRYAYEEGGKSYRITVPAGFEHDGASVPKVVWSLYRPHKLDRAAVFHDLIYKRGGALEPGEHQLLDGEDWVDVDRQWSRDEADLLFKRLLKLDPNGPGLVHRRLAYLGVRSAGGRHAWRGPPADLPRPRHRPRPNRV
jgi:hypothetical protein